MIRVAIVEDDALTREGLLMHLRRRADFVCVGAHENGKDALRYLPGEKPDVVLMDINLPGLNGIECVAALKAAHPDIQVLMLTTYDDSDRIFESLRAGASGYLLKRTAPAQLVKAIEEVRNGGSPMSMQIARKVVSHFHQIKKPERETDKLSAREMEILALLAKGALYKEIADQLGISLHTVRNHLHGIYGKIHVQTRTEAVLKYLDR
ncbi:MAG: response regulator transcription factor [Chthoniobacterales bacterium]